jgi:hypothetical protein
MPKRLVRKNASSKPHAPVTSRAPKVLAASGPKHTRGSAPSGKSTRLSPLRAAKIAPLARRQSFLRAGLWNTPQPPMLLLMNSIHRAFTQTRENNPAPIRPLAPREMLLAHAKPHQMESPTPSTGQECRCRARIARRKRIWQCDRREWRQRFRCAGRAVAPRPFTNLPVVRVPPGQQFIPSPINPDTMEIYNRPEDKPAAQPEADAPPPTPAYTSPALPSRSPARRPLSRSQKQNLISPHSSSSWRV